MNDDFHARILALAQQQAAVAARSEVLNALIAENHAKYVAPHADELDRIRIELMETERQLRTDLLDYMTSTGDLHVHPSASIRRNTEVVYDKDEVLDQLRKLDRMEYVRIKVELDVRRFEKAVRAGEIDLIEVEIVNKPVVVLDKLGDLLIAHDSGLIGDDGRSTET